MPPHKSNKNLAKMSEPFFRTREINKRFSGTFSQEKQLNFNEKRQLGAILTFHGPIHGSPAVLFVFLILVLVLVLQ